MAFAFHHSELEFFSMRGLIPAASSRDDTLKLTGQLFIDYWRSHIWLMFSKLHYNPKNVRKYDWLQIDLKIFRSLWPPKSHDSKSKKRGWAMKRVILSVFLMEDFLEICTLCNFLPSRQQIFFSHNFAANGSVNCYSISASSVNSVFKTL